ncbi:MAG: hypothetical protein JW891_16170 [Candidatus Lokiarchaeota archaeon]|nr:hypothetical protein [Candidatus Lokiarchaeota archaeon]
MLGESIRNAVNKLTIAKECLSILNLIPRGVSQSQTPGIVFSEEILHYINSPDINIEELNIFMINIKEFLESNRDFEVTVDFLDNWKHINSKEEKIEILAKALNIIDIETEIINFNHIQLNDLVINPLIDKLGIFVFKMFIADSVSIDSEGNWGFVALYSLTINDLFNFLKSNFIMLFGKEIFFSNQFKDIANALECYLNTFKNNILLREKELDTTLSRLLTIVYKELDRWAYQENIHEGTFDVKYAYIALKTKEISQLKNTDCFIVELLRELMQNYRKIQSKNLQALVSPEFKFLGNNYRFEFSAESIEELSHINIPYIETTRLFTRIAVGDLQINSRNLLLKENYNIFAKNCYEELLKINSEYNDKEGVVQSSKLYFIFSRHPIRKQEIYDPLFNQEYYYLDFSKQMEDASNYVNLKLIFIALYNGYSIRFSKTTDEFVPNKPNYIGRLNFVDCSSDFFGSTNIERKIYNNIILKYRDKCSASLALFVKQHGAIFPSYQHILHSSPISYLHLLFSYDRLDYKLHLLRYINLKALNDRMLESGNNDWMKFLTALNLNSQDLSMINIMQIDKTLLKLFIDAILKIYNLDQQGNKIGNPINIDIESYYHPSSYYFEINPIFSEDLLIVNY